MAINQILPFGTVSGANVLAPADYQALAARLAGFSAGTAKSKELNTVWRQASFVAAMIGQYVADKAGQDVLDNGDLAALQAKFVAALAASPALTGTPTAPTPAATDKSTRIATTAFVSGNFPRVYSINALPAQDVGPIIVAECGEVWIWGTSPIYTGYRSPLCGQIAHLPFSKVPYGWMRANGAAASVSAYGALASTLYCGDALNATAPVGYRCTNAADPTNTRSTTGAYIVLPDLRGEFVRGWDDGRSVDAGRQLGSSQRASRVIGAVSNPSFPYLSQNGEWRFSTDNGNVSFKVGDAFTEGYDITSGSGSFLAGWSYANIGTSAALASVRPRNVALFACIKY